MGSVAQAVVEFDEAVQAPWRPPLAGATGRRGQLRVVEGPARRSVGARPGLGGRPPAGAPIQGRRPAPLPSRRPVRGGDPVTRRPAPGGRTGTAVPSGLRFTRRARRLGVVLGLAVGVVAGSWVGSAFTGGDSGLRLAGGSSVVVERGDTLWSIAAGVAGDGDDVRAVIAEIKQLNGLGDASLLPGQELDLP